MRTATATAPQGTGRLGRLKSSTGCLTCKIRKVKCDEQHPFCRRCVNTGRKCDGYAPRPVSRPLAKIAESQFAIRRNPGAYQQRDLDEVASFEYFVQHFIPTSTRIVDEHFWRKLVPQMSQADPIIWNAVNAMTNLMRYTQDLSTSALTDVSYGPKTNTNHQQALQWYGRSIAGLREHMRQSRSLSVTTMITFVLYMCIECLQENKTQALAVWRQALVVMDTTSDTDNAGVASNNCHAVQVSVLSFLRHLTITQGLPVHLEPQTQSLMDKGKVTLPQARDVLYEVLGDIYQFMTLIEEIKLVSEKSWTPSHQLHSQCQALETRLAHLRSLWEPNITFLGLDPRSAEEEMLHMLLLVYYNHSIILATSLDTSDTAYDRFEDDFLAMLWHAEHVINLSKTETPIAFSLETRFIPALSFVALKCRHPIIRRRALVLLRKCPAAENLWRSRTALAVAQKIVAIEESGCLDDTYRETPVSLNLPRESHRAFLVKFVDPANRDHEARRVVRIRRWQETEDHHWISKEDLIAL